VKYAAWLCLGLVGCADLFATDGDSRPVDLGDLASCQSVADWDPDWAAFEDRVLELTNAARAAGHDCDSEGKFGPAAPLAMNARLRCSARLHSGYMAETGDFDHVESKSGTDPFDRMEAAGYRFSSAGENIALGQRTPEEVVNGWLDSDGHCSNIMNRDFTEIGVGYAEGTAAPLGFQGTAPYWTQNFGSPF
jgi:uncharacterized protein YkwD